MKTMLLVAAACAAGCGTAAAQGLQPAREAAPPPPQVVAAPAPAPTAAASAAATSGHGQVPPPIPAAASGVASNEPPLPGEPAVRHIVVEDDHTRIDELRVRNVPQKIVVTSKAGKVSSTYEIITGDGSRDLSPGANTSRGATGKSVWRVLDF
jgi:hypothetical protein